MVWHMVDRADRFHNGEEIESKAPPVLMRAIHSVWIKIFGPPKYMIIDGEGGIVAADTAADLKRLSNTLVSSSDEEHYYDMRCTAARSSSSEKEYL